MATAIVDLTPPLGYPLGGYVARRGLATGTADPLQATLIWIAPADKSTGSARGPGSSRSAVSDPGLLWLCVDAMAVDTALAYDLSAAAATAARMPTDRVLVCASHSHSAPSGWSGSVHPVIPADRDPGLVRALTDAVAAAELTPVPVRMTWHTAEITGVGTNRYRTGGPHHRTAGILAMRSTSGLLAVLLDYACHPTVLGPDNLRWSADWPGAARRAITAATGGVVGFLQGAAGDVSPRFTRRGRDAAEVARTGNRLATQVLAALATPGTPVAGSPQIHRATVTVPVRQLPPVAAIDATIARARAGTGGANSESPAGRIATTRLEGARGQRAMRAAGLPDNLDLPISVVRIGELAWLHLPVEPFSTLGNRLRATSPFPTTRTVGYTDGYFGYLVDAAAEREELYEALISYFDTPATTHLLAAATSLLHQAFLARSPVRRRR